LFDLSGLGNARCITVESFLSFLWLVAIWHCTSFHYFGWVEVQLNEIKAKHRPTELSQVIGGKTIHMCFKLDRNLAALEFCNTFPGKIKINDHISTTKFATK